MLPKDSSFRLLGKKGLDGFRGGEALWQSLEAAREADSPDPVGVFNRQLRVESRERKVEGKNSGQRKDAPAEVHPDHPKGQV